MSTTTQPTVSTPAVTAPVDAKVATVPKPAITVLKTLTSEEVAALKPEQLPNKPKKVNPSVFPDSRTVRYLNEKYMNEETQRRLSELAKKLEPVYSSMSILEKKREPQFDAAGKQLVGDDGKPKFVDLTEARARELTAKIEAAAKETAVLEDEVRALKAISYHFSKHLGAKFRDILVEISRELLVAAADSCLTKDKKIITVQMLKDNAKDLVCLPLIQNLPSWINPPEPRQKKEAEEEAAVPVAADPAAEVPHEEDSETGSATFLYYLTEMCSELAHPTQLNADGTPVTEVRLIRDKNGLEKHQRITKHSDSKYCAIRTSNDFKQYLNNLIFEFYASLSPMLQNQMVSLNVKTLNEDILMSVIRAYMLHGQPAKEKIVYSKTMAADPVAVANLKKANKAAREAKTPLDTRKEKDLPQVEVTVATKELVYDDVRYEKFMNALKVAAKLWETAEPAVPEVAAAAVPAQ